MGMLIWVQCMIMYVVSEYSDRHFVWWHEM
jgi:hypothetical protein